MLFELPTLIPKTITVLIKLVLLFAGRPVRNDDFNQACITCGRDSGSDIVVNHDNVSPKHLCIERLSNGVCQVVDFGSVIGVRLNGQAIRAAAFKPNDRIHFGKWCIRFR